MRPLYYGVIVVDMTDREVERHREVVAGHHAAYHLIHVGEILRWLVVGETSHDKPFEASEGAVEPKSVEHTLHAIDSLAHILNKKDSVRAKDVETCGNQSAKHCKVSAEDLRFSLATATKRMRGDRVRRHLALQDVEKRERAEIGGVLREVLAH